MAKTLKLVGVQTYCGVLTNGTPVTNGDVCTFSDSASVHLLKGEEKNEIGDGIPHWKETTEEAHWDFSGVEMPSPAYAARGGNRTAKPRIGEEADGDPADAGTQGTQGGGENSNLVETARAATQRKARAPARAAK